ncbi:MAG: hypothetical protein ACRD1O_01700 [Terriglobia bacterium]
MQRINRAHLVCAILLAISLLLSPGLRAQTSSPVPGAAVQPPPQAASAKINEVDLLKQQLLEQQKQIEALRIALQKQQQLLQQLTTKAEAAKPDRPAALPASPEANSPSRPFAATPAEAASATQPADKSKKVLEANALAPAIVSNSAPSTASYDSDRQMNPAVPNSPIAPIPLRIGRATLTPLGFVDATEFWRSKNLESGIGAAFGSVPFSNTTEGHLSENRFTIQNSRIGLMMDSAFGANTVRAYLEADFLGTQQPAAYVTSNNDSLRVRLYWVDLKRGKFEFLAGQSWSLLTPGRIGISPMPSSLFYTQDVDTNYQVGLTWARQLQFRFTYHATPHVTAALSLENAEQYTGGAVSFPAGFDSSQVDTGGNTSTPNLAPDLIGKVAFDGHAAGKLMHLEFAGLLSAFKIINPALTRTDTAVGAGGSVNFNLELFKNFHLLFSSFYSDGGGRYIFGLGPDFIVRPDFTISPVHAYSGIGGFEYNITPKTLIYGYYGGAYYDRNFSVVPPTSPTGSATFVGYGYPGSSNSANKSIQEPTFGIIQNFWKNAHYGALQLITQYSYLTRAPWFVAPNNPKNANLSQVYIDLRYVLP